MGKFDGISLISDIDGTLFTSPTTIPKENAEAIDYFIGNGGRFSIATGRSHISILRNMDKFRVNAPCIVMNGTGLYDYCVGDFLVKRICNERLRWVTARASERFQNATCCVFSGDDMYSPFLGKYRERIEQIEQMPIQIMDFGQMGTSWLKSIFFTEPDVLTELRAYVDSLNDGSFDTVFSDKMIYELVPKGVNKGTMVAEYSRATGVPMKNICAIGDFYNDWEMLEAAGYSATPAGAPDDIKAMTDVTVCLCADGAVADFIRVIEENLERFDQKNAVN